MGTLKGIVARESLADDEWLNYCKILKTKLDDDWHILTVEVDSEKVKDLMHAIKDKWYAHFWRDTTVIVIFKDRLFFFDHEKKATWKETIDYGKKIGIPEKQLDFPID